MRPERHVDLRRLPAALQYAIALAVVGVVAGVALLTSDGDDGPSWLTGTLPPILGLLAILVAAVVIVAQLRRPR